MLIIPLFLPFFSHFSPVRWHYFFFRIVALQSWWLFEWNNTIKNGNIIIKHAQLTTPTRYIAGWTTTTKTQHTYADYMHGAIHFRRRSNSAALPCLATWRKLKASSSSNALKLPHPAMISRVCYSISSTSCCSYFRANRFWCVQNWKSANLIWSTLRSIVCAMVNHSNWENIRKAPKLKQSPIQPCKSYSGRQKMKSTLSSTFKPAANAYMHAHYGLKPQIDLHTLIHHTTYDTYIHTYLYV